ncbi:hypothetical protein DCS_04977 [Drechmeria coniospora]|uniref:Uncharacterized protein n=1 Tax=Drechmeria coniospora TaxID=98403 RepID=A0A151GLH7_DRECN|nr:hypothetical protein DCS_04977 [Drechmeria coniospora]KYK57964.1 hypothetical protein DCS_04977 [Drechmeria coniospora]ODA83193.1 hypothetical protein RJ55_01704 [Drechmeria coniospora]
MSVDEAHLSVRFKHGIHTIYLFVDALAPFSAVTEELVGLLRERYPAGLTTSVAPPKQTVVPADAKLAYAVLAVPNEPAKGWRRLKVGEDEAHTPTKCGLKNNSIVAFAVLADDADDATFEVEWPQEDDDVYEQGN